MFKVQDLRFWLVALLMLLAAVPAGAVLKERNLARTLGVLRAELETDRAKQQAFMARYEQQGAAQHQQLVAYMNQCEQIGLMLYSQSADNTFDMAYACQQAVNLYRQLNGHGGRALPYDKMIARMRSEIERYDALIASLKAMPPVLEDSVLTASDSILLNAIDSLESEMPRGARTKGAPPVATVLADRVEDDEVNEEPLYLNGQQLVDRRECLRAAETLRNGMQAFLEDLEAESSYYKSVQEKVEQLNTFAQRRYRLLQDHIYRTGDANYFSVLAQLPRFLRQAGHSASKKYAPFSQPGGRDSEWRGVPVLFISVFVVFYLLLSLGLTYVVLRWLLPKRWRGEKHVLRRRMLTNVLGIALFACIVMVVRQLVDRNFIQMSTSLIITMAWLLEVISLSLYIRLKGQQMRHGALIYTPLMLLSSFVVMLRIVLMPNSLLTVLLPGLRSRNIIRNMAIKFLGSLPLMTKRKPEN